MLTRPIRPWRKSTADTTKSDIYRIVDGSHLLIARQRILLVQLPSSTTSTEKGNKGQSVVLLPTSKSIIVLYLVVAVHLLMTIHRPHVE
jgi:hypothetical protein